MRFAIAATGERVEVESSILVRWLLLALLPISVNVYGATRMLRAHDLVLMESDGVTCTLAPDNPEIRRSVAVGSVRRVTFRTTSGGVVIFLDTNAGEIQVPEAIPRSQQPEV